jgi:hypothetical protein
MNVDEIKEYCKARLQEIEFINHVSHTPSAMVALAAFVGYLSRLAFWGHASIPGVTWNGGLIGTDEEAFNAFIDKFMPKYAQYFDVQQIGTGTGSQTRKHYWLYAVLRCGLVHSMSFYDKWNPNQPWPAQPLPKPHIVVSHDPKYSSPNDPVSYTQHGVNAIVINAFDLCVDVNSAIEAMFQDSDVRSNAERFVGYQPPICGLSSATLQSSDSPNMGLSDFDSRLSC